MIMHITDPSKEGIGEVIHTFWTTKDPPGLQGLKCLLGCQCSTCPSGAKYKDLKMRFLFLLMILTCSFTDALALFVLTAGHLNISQG